MPDYSQKLSSFTFRYILRKQNMFQMEFEGLNGMPIHRDICKLSDKISFILMKCGITVKQYNLYHSARCSSCTSAHFPEVEQT